MVTAAEKRMYENITAECKEGESPMWFWLRWKAQTDLYFLGTEIFDFGEARDPKTRRKRCDPKMHKRMAKSLESNEDALLLWPRNHCKTTWVKYRLVQIIIQNPFARTGLWSRTSGLAKLILKNVKSLLRNPTLVDLFPEILKVPKWEKDTATELTVYRPVDEGQNPPTENQVEAWGIEGTVTGRHYDYHFYDDVINEQSVTTAEQIEKVETWWQHVQAIREVTATEKMIGTRYHERDIYNKIIREKFFPTVERYKALQAGKPLYSYFRLKDLDKMKKRMGDWVFSCQMMNEPVPPSDKLFMQPYPFWHNLPEDPKYYIAVDPALAKKWSNKTGIAVGCVDRQNPSRLYYVLAYSVKKPPDKLANEIVKLIAKFRPQRVGIEFGLQEGLQYILELKLREVMRQVGIAHPEILPISTGKIQKHLKIDRTLGAFTRMQKALFHPSLTELFRQMDFYNPHSEDNDDDVLDACSMLIQTVEHFAQHHWDNVQPEGSWKGWTFFDLHKPETKEGWDRKLAS